MSLYLYKAFGFDVILVETLGVGQDEIDIANFVDIQTVHLFPATGLQSNDQGRHYGNCRSVTSSISQNRPGSDHLKNEIEGILSLKQAKRKASRCETSAERNEGISELIETIEAVRARTEGTKRSAAERE
jgi:LAO/AO transport system kinase